MGMHSIRLPEKLDQELNTLITPTFSRSMLIRHALTEYVKRNKFMRLRKQVLPFAEAQGLLTDEDVFEAIS